MRRKRFCPDCGSGQVTRSRHHGLVERLMLSYLQLRPYRCQECNARFYGCIHNEPSSSEAA